MKTTIAQRKKAAGWINNDARKSLVYAGKLRPGNKDGEKCLCCSSLSRNHDRCQEHDIPTGINSYCPGFSQKQHELGKE